MSSLERAILQSMEEGILAIDFNGRILLINQAASSFLGLSGEEITGRLLARLEGELAKLCETLFSQSLHSEERIAHSITLQERFFNLIATPIAEGISLIIQDKTTDYQIIQKEKEFITFASHELRTPFTVVRGFSETLRDLPNLSKEMMKEIADKMVSACMRLDKIVSSLLTLADIETLSEERCSYFDLVPLAKECADFIQVLAPSAAIQVHTEGEKAMLKGDRDLLELALINLLENAVRYSTSPAKIELFIEIQPGFTNISVQDHGIGIASSDLTQIFNRFFTVNKARSRKAGGVGLGLAIVKSIIEKHKGKVTVISQLGHGSRFTLHLPTYDAAKHRLYAGELALQTQL